MQRLNNQRSATVDKTRGSPDDSFDRFFSDERKIRDRDIRFDVQSSGSDFFVRRDAEVTATCLSCLFNQSGNDIHADRAYAMRRESAREPALTASNVEHRARRSTQHCLHDCSVGDEGTTGDLIRADRSRPGCGIPAPGFHDPRIVQAIGGHLGGKGSVAVTRLGAARIIGGNEPYIQRDT